MSGPHHVVAVVYDDYQALDLSGPMEVVVGATTAGADPAYTFEVASLDGRPVRSESGLCIVPDTAIDSIQEIDTLLIVGGRGVGRAIVNPEFLNGIGDLAARASRVTSVCSGALALAAAGLLDGREATTHWSTADDLARYPDVRVDADRLWVRDGTTWTSAGVTAGIDLFLAIVEADHGADLAHLIARYLVVFVQRPGGQAQFSSHMRTQPAKTEPIRDLQRWIPANLRDDLSVSSLAEQAGLSTRTLSRRFGREVGISPGAFVETARIEGAKQLLESTDLTVAAVARDVGFGHGETMHRAFVRQVGTTPAQYRNHFSTRKTT